MPAPSGSSKPGSGCGRGTTGGAGGGITVEDGDIPVAGETSGGAARTEGRPIPDIGEGSGGRGTAMKVPGRSVSALRPGLTLRRLSTLMPQARAIEASVSPTPTPTRPGQAASAAVARPAAIAAARSRIPLARIPAP